MKRGRDYKAERMRAGISQHALAIELGIHRTLLSAIETEQVIAQDGFAADFADALEHLGRERGVKI